MKFLLLLTFLISLTQAQINKYNVVIKSPFNDTLLSVIQDYGNTISAVGFYKHYKSSNNSSKTYLNPFNYLSHVGANYGINIHLVKINDSAKIILNKSISLHEFSKAVSVVKTPSNGYFVGGYTLNGNLLILKLNAQGQTIFIKKFGLHQYDSINKMIALKDGGVLVVGSSMSQDGGYSSMFNNGLGLHDIILIRISRHGQILWNKKFGTAYNDYGIDVTQAKDATFIVMGITAYKTTTKIVLIHVSQGGSIIWYKTYLDKKYLKPYSLILLRNNDFLISFDTKNRINKQQQINLSKFNLQGTLLIHVKINSEYPSALLRIKEDKNGYIIGVGKITDKIYYNTDGLFMKLSTSLHILTQRHFGSKYYDIFKDIIILRDGKYIAVGNKSTKNSQISNMWIVKLNKNGTIAQK